MFRKAITTVSLIIAAIVALAWLTPAESNAPAVFIPAPSATPTYPACLTEDGAGQALCYWDAQSQGNGQGTSVLSGDCAPDIMGEAASAECVMTHAQPSVTETYQGAVTEWPNGADLVAECIDENRGMTNAEKAENGFSLIECFKAQRME